MSEFPKTIYISHCPAQPGDGSSVAYDVSSGVADALPGAPVAEYRLVRVGKVEPTFVARRKSRTPRPVKDLDGHPVAAKPRKSRAKKPV